MTLRILGREALTDEDVHSTGISGGNDLVRSARLVSSMQITYPAFAELKHNSKHLLDSAAANAEGLLDDLKRVKSVIDQLIEQFSRLRPASGAETATNVIKTVSNLTVSIPRKKLTTLFDPRRNEEFLEKLWSSPLLREDDPGTLIKQFPETQSLLEEASARTKSLIASNERILVQSAVAQENISASNSIPERGTTTMK